MDNVASVNQVMLRPGAILPCVRILRGIDIACRQYGANFALNLSFSYPVAGVVVTTPTTAVLVSATTAMEGRDPAWQVVNVPWFAVAHQPDAGANITCNVLMTITAPISNIVFPTGYLDTEVLPVSATGW